MLLGLILTAGRLAPAIAQGMSSSLSSSMNSSSRMTGLFGGNVASGGDYATGTFISYVSTIPLGGTSNVYTTDSLSATGTTNGATATNSTTTRSRGSSSTRTLLVGTSQVSARNATSSSTSAARPSNMALCNGYNSFYNRKYINISMVGAHNSPFQVRNNVASNQMLDVTTQLNDGIRMLQFQVHKPNESSPLLLCHTSCDLLNARTLVNYLTTTR